MLNYLFERLFTKDIPLLDVRAETEYTQGAFPSAINMPILNDSQRHDVGICYKQKGPQAAERLGYELVSGNVRDQRLAKWTAFVTAHPDTHLYCFRGGKRSQIACQWLDDTGLSIPRIAGGYKAMRSYLLQSLSTPPPLLVVSGHTGVGKTDLLREFSSSIDLEGLASHRGSAFGKRLKPQPTQINFENSLAIELLKKKDAPPIVLEDEGRLIGRIQIPVIFKEAMNAAPIVLLEEPRALRVERILHDYIIAQFDELRAIHGDLAYGFLSDQLLTATDAIRKRLGGVAHQKVRSLVVGALRQHATGDIEGHRIWISMLLEKYYDPMYSYQLENKRDRIVFTGSSTDILDWFASPRRVIG